MWQTLASRSLRFVRSQVYRFQVSNPLKVKTKAHSPSPQSPTTLLSKTERSKVFLEVLLENLCEQAMSFERVRFDSTGDWTSHDANHLSSVALSLGAEPISLFSGEAALLPPGAVRQYLWVLTPTAAASPAAPGASQALGRLDIAWRTPNGEPGRLQTAMLGRKVPLAAGGAIRSPMAPPLIPPSAFEKALPPLADSVTSAGSPVPAGSPSQRGSPAPYLSKSLSASQAARQSATPAPRPAPHLPDSIGLEFDLTLSSITPAHPALDRPFTLTFELDVSDRSPPPLIQTGARVLKLVAQHVAWHTTPASIAPPQAQDVKPAGPAVVLAVPGQGAVLPSQALGTTSLGQQQLRSPGNSAMGGLSSRASIESLRGATLATQDALAGLTLSDGPSNIAHGGVSLPKPLPLAPSNPGTPSASRQIVRVGPSTVTLPPLVLPAGGEPASAKFKMRFMGLEPGLWRVGGLRVLLVEEWTEGEEGQESGEGVERKARVVWETEVVAEVCVGMV